MGTFKINGELELNSYLTAATNLYVSSASNTSIIFRHGSTEYVRINPSGCLNIGSTQTASTYKLYVAGKTWLSDTLYFNNTASYINASDYTGNAATATKLTTATAGDSNTPVYFTGGKPVACTSLDLNTTGNAATATKATQDGDGAVISSTYLKLAGGTMTGTIVTPGNDSVVIKPAKNNYDQIGASDYKFWKIFASTFYGNLSGTASIASTLEESLLETTDAADAFLAENTFKVAKATSAATTINNDGMILSAGYSGGWGAQIWLDDGSGAASMRIRNRSGATSWNGWRKVWLEGDSVTGAVWNDYAEYREADTVEPGYVLIETGKDNLVKSNERLSHFAGISSDTWGFSQGETEKAKTPIAVAGRVLAYPYQNRNNYKPGDCVCAAPGGTVDIMAREEMSKYPDRIVGTVSCVPDYEDWGGGDRPPVKVNGRIWIKIK